MAKGDRVIRLVRMILLIESRPGLSAEELAKICGISVRNCYRDLQVLCCAGVPIYNDNGYRLLEKSRLKTISLTLEEALALIYGVKLLEKQRGPIRPGVKIKEKLLELLPRQLQHEIEDYQKQVEVSVEPTIDYSEAGGLFKKINDAIRQQQILDLEYYSFSRDDYTTRAVDPYQIVYRDGFWYLVAYCHKRDEIRLFRVDRIRKLEFNSDRFLKPPDFDLQCYLGSAWQMERGEEYNFKVHFWGNAARFVRETHFHQSQKLQEIDDGSLLFSANACSLKSVIRWVLQFGGEAEVMEPIELRQQVAQELGMTIQKYKEK